MPLGLDAVAAGESRHLQEEVAGEHVRPDRARVELEQDVHLLANRRQEKERAEDPLRLAPPSRVERVPEMGIVAPGRQLDRALSQLAAPVVGCELVVDGGRSNVANQELDIREHHDRLDLWVLRACALEEIPRAIEPRPVLVIAGDEGPRRLYRRLGARRERDDEDGCHGDRDAGSHRANSTARYGARQS